VRVLRVAAIAAGIFAYFAGAALTHAQIVQFSGASVVASYTGVIDQYPSEGWTSGFSVYAPSRTYAGNFATIERLSDSTTTTIGYSSGVASASQFNSFCSGTYCYVKTLNDSFGSVEGHENDWSQSTLANMPAIAVAADGLLEVCPTPSSSMANSYSASQSTAKVEMFAVAYAATLDWNGWQANLPYFTITGNLSTSTDTVTSITQSGVASTFQGFSTSGGGIWNPGQPGIEDVTHNGAIWWEDYVGTAAGGATSLTRSLGINSLLNETGDTFQLTNAVIGGPWVVVGPASGAFQTSAYWAFALAPACCDTSAGDIYPILNTSNIGNPTVVGEQMRGKWAVWDWDTYSGTLYYDGNELWSNASSTNVTYSTNVGMTLFSNTNGSENTSNQCFHQMAFINQTAANRATVGSWLGTQFATTTLSTSASSYVDPDGFTIKPEFLPNGANLSGTNPYGNYSVVDANGITWHPQTGGYLHGGMPGNGYATNVVLGACTPGTNCPTKWRYIVDGGDSDVNETQHPRSEMDSVSYGDSGTFASATAAQHWSTFWQFKFEQIPDMVSRGSEWCLSGQIHYNTLSSPPDIFAFDCLDRTSAGQATLVATVNDVNCGSTINIVAGTVYAVEIEGYYNPSGASTTVVKWGPNGGTLTNGCTSTSVASDTGIYAKNGIYTGDVPWRPWKGVVSPQNIIYDSYNQVWSTTAGTFSSYITTQPALPTH